MDEMEEIDVPMHNLGLQSAEIDHSRDIFTGEGNDTFTSGSTMDRSRTENTRGGRKRKPAPEREVTLPIRKVGRPRGSGNAHRTGRGGGRRELFGETGNAENASGDSDDIGLFGAVLSGKNIDKAVDEWIDAYEGYPDDGMLKLMQCLISCCGSKFQLSRQMIPNIDYSDIIGRMRDDFDEDERERVACPLVKPGAQGKLFRERLHNLISTLIDKCKSSIVFDERMMDDILQFLTQLSGNNLRQFRLTAVFVAMKLCSALVNLTIEIIHAEANNSRQIDAERARHRGNKRASGKLDMLLMKKQEIRTKTGELREMVQCIFKRVFVQRYRDMFPDIRSICLAELGNWMLVYPEHFLEDSYLKYIGWSLHDKVSDVRLKCISSLLQFYENEDMRVKLELFTDKFKVRLVSMAYDKDNEVAVKACYLLKYLHLGFPSILTPSDCVHIYELVYCNIRALAVAAGEFLNMKVFQCSLKSDIVDGEKTSEESQNLVRNLINFYMEGEHSNQAQYLVDAVIDTNPIIKDWDSMVELLLSDEVDETIELPLIEVMCCSATQTITGEHPAGRTVGKRGAPSTKPCEVPIDHKGHLTEVFIPALPQLIQKFIADSEKIALLVPLPVYFQLDMYMAGRLEHHLEKLMEVLKIVLERHTDEDIISSVAQVIVHLTSNRAVDQHIETSRIKILDGIGVQFRHAADLLQTQNEFDEEDQAAILSAFKKIAAFSSMMDVKSWEIWELMMNLLYDSDEKMSRAVVEKAILFLASRLLWDLLRLVHDKERNKNEAMEGLIGRREQFIQLALEILSGNAFGAEPAFLCLADCMMIFKQPLLTDGENNLEPLVMDLSQYDIEYRMEVVLTDNVFCYASENRTDTPARRERIQKNRLLLNQYCKLIIHGILGIQDAGFLLTYLCSHSADYGDILRQLLYKCRDLDLIATGKAFSRALILRYGFIAGSQMGQIVDPLCDDFRELRELSRKFANAFGTDYVKTREAVVVVHRDVIKYALTGHDPSDKTEEGGSSKAAPINLPFIEALVEFTPKLLPSDKATVLDYLERSVGNVNSKEQVWHSYLIYKHSLVENENVSFGGFPTSATPRGGGTRGRPRGSRSGNRAAIVSHMSL